MRKRNHVIPVRLNAKELRELEEQVEKSGLSREEFMRSLILGAQVHAKPCEHHPELLRKIAGLCNLHGADTYDLRVWCRSCCNAESRRAD